MDSMFAAELFTVEDMLKLTGLSLARRNTKHAALFCDLAMDSSVALDDPRLMAAANGNLGVIQIMGPFTKQALNPLNTGRT